MRKRRNLSKTLIVVKNTNNDSPAVMGCRVSAKDSLLDPTSICVIRFGISIGILVPIPFDGCVVG